MTRSGKTRVGVPVREIILTFKIRAGSTTEDVRERVQFSGIVDERGSLQTIVALNADKAEIKVKRNAVRGPDRPAGLTVVYRRGTAVLIYKRELE